MSKNPVLHGERSLSAQQLLTVPPRDAGDSDIAHITIGSIDVDDTSLSPGDALASHVALVGGRRGHITGALSFIKAYRTSDARTLPAKNRFF
jgi:hypothetical protein